MTNLSDKDGLTDFWTMACKMDANWLKNTDKYLDEIMSHYSEPHRAYHNLRHIQDLFIHFNEHQDQLKAPELVIFAIFYHDIIYQVQKRNNEQASAILAAQRLQEIGLSEDQIQIVCEMILGSQSHQFMSSLHPDCAYLFDFDLSILGGESTNYESYSAAIRKEYEVYPDEVYYPARKAVLEKFLNRKKIYWTDHFVEAFELQARTNLQHEIEVLSHW